MRMSESGVGAAVTSILQAVSLPAVSSEAAVTLACGSCSCVSAAQAGVAACAVRR